MIRAARNLSLALAGVVAVSAGATAAPMTPDECDRAKIEQSNLESGGVTVDMAKGPEWARANLEPTRLARVARWIELQEQILFRCPRPKPAPEPVNANVATPPPGEKKPSKVKSSQKPKPAAAASESETGDAGDPPLKRQKPAAGTQKKPKADDAFRPPPLPPNELQHAAPGLSVPQTGGTGLAP